MRWKPHVRFGSGPRKRTGADAGTAPRSDFTSRLVRLPDMWVKKVRLGPDRVEVVVALRRRRLQCPRCEFTTAARKDTRPVESVWRHLDLGVWRLEIHCRRRRLRCPRHGLLAEGVPFARHRSGFTRDFECLVAWLAAHTDKSAICRLLRVHWDTVGRIITRVCADQLDPDRLSALFDIGIETTCRYCARRQQLV